jgi:hypothetical protein
VLLTDLGYARQSLGWAGCTREIWNREGTSDFDSRRQLA